MTDSTVKRRREILTRLMRETLPGIAKEYRHIPDVLVRTVLKMYLSKEEKQEALVRMFFSSRVFARLSKEERTAMAGITADDILTCMEEFTHLPKVSVIHRILRDNYETFARAVEHGRSRIRWTT